MACSWPIPWPRPAERQLHHTGSGRPPAARDSLDGTLHQAFAYDSNGNRTSLTTALGTVSSSHDAQDRLTRSATSGGVVTLYAYGSNGELKTKTDSATGAPTRYQYDALGNLLKVVLPTGDSVEYLIDGQNRRVGRKLNGAVTHRWLYQNQLNPIAELDSAGALVSRFVYGSRANVPDYLVRGGAVYRLVTDHLGSVRAVVDTATGAVAQWTSYDAWGNVLADSGAGFQPFGFAGGLTDGATGLVRFGARDYEPQVGRWTAKDP
ncbi:MAG: RHS repeat-associated core domain-containing protein, partial [Gemmatimonadetes bacterium]|nr:RHS repeat-associated core domain-containing protein [Gemmatimonadota bacterium]